MFNGIERTYSTTDGDAPRDFQSATGVMNRMVGDMCTNFPILYQYTECQNKISKTFITEEVTIA